MLSLITISLLALLPDLAISKPLASKRDSAPPISDQHVALFHGSNITTRDTHLTANTYYYGDFNLAGNPINAIVDTGSSSLNIQKSAAPSGSYSNVMGSCSSLYGGKEAVTGQVATGTYHFSQYTVGGRFCLIEQGGNFQAIMGLSFPPPGGNSVAGQYGDGPLEQFAERGLTSFSIFLAEDPSRGGTFTVNGHRPNYVYPGGSFVYENRVQSDYHWGFGIEQPFLVGNNQYSWGKNLAIIDTGNPHISVPQAAAQNIWKAVGANSDGSYNTCNPGGDPVIIATDGDHYLQIDAVNYVLQTPSGGCINAFRPQQANANTPYIILGVPFIKQYYTFFDRQNQRLGFAPSAG